MARCAGERASGGGEVDRAGRGGPMGHATMMTRGCDARTTATPAG
jgi:hypothetical protein